jgi:hypothetical protein
MPNLNAKRFTKKRYSKSTKIGSSGNVLTTSNFDSLSRAEFFFSMICFLEEHTLSIAFMKNFKAKRFTGKKIFKFYQCVYM